MPDPFVDLHNADLTVTRSSGTRDASGYTEGSTTTVLTTRCDAQETSRRIEGDDNQMVAVIRCYVKGGVAGVEPGDGAEVAFDDGRTRTGEVVQVSGLDDKVTVRI